MQLLNALAGENEVELIVFEKHLNFEQAFSGTHIAKLEKGIGEINTMVAIAYLLNRFNANLNVGKSITNTQSAQIAADIMEKHPHETIEDIVLMLKYVRQGIIGDGKDFKVDGQNVLAKWMPEYLDKKYFEVEKYHERLRNEKVDEKSSGEHPVSIYYKKLRDKKASEARMQKAKDYIDKMTKNMNRQLLEDTIKEWENDPEMKPYIGYLKSKRKLISGDYYE